jgi:3-phosphoshikimate 1-carboxyvinyltransferase
MLRAMGVQVDSRILPGFDGTVQFETVLQPAARLNPLRMSLPGDFSSAAFLVVAALICEGSDIVLEGVGLNPTRTGLLDALRAMGANLEISETGEAGGEPCGDIRVRHSRLSGTTISGPLVVRMIDEFPALAVAAVFADGPTVVSGAGELRYKESDRIRALCTQLRSIGVEAQERPDGFILPGGSRPSGGAVHPAGDHRIAMAFAVAGLGASGPVTVSEAEIIAESYPGFVETLQRLGAKVEL